MGEDREGRAPAVADNRGVADGAVVGRLEVEAGGARAYADEPEMRAGYGKRASTGMRVDEECARPRVGVASHDDPDTGGCSAYLD